MWFFFFCVKLIVMKQENPFLKKINLSNAIYMIVGFALVIAFLIVLIVFINSTSNLGLNPEIGLGWRFSSNDLSVLSERLAIEKYGFDEVNNNPLLINEAKIEILSAYSLRDGTYIFNGTNLPPWQTLFFVGFGIWFVVLAIINGFRISKANDFGLKALAVIDIFGLNIATGIFIFNYIKDKNGGEHLA